MATYLQRSEPCCRPKAAEDVVAICTVESGRARELAKASGHERGVADYSHREETMVCGAVRRVLRPCTSALLHLVTEHIEPSGRQLRRNHEDECPIRRGVDPDIYVKRRVVEWCGAARPRTPCVGVVVEH